MQVAGAKEWNAIAIVGSVLLVLALWITGEALWGMVTGRHATDDATCDGHRSTQ